MQRILEITGPSMSFEQKQGGCRPVILWGSDNRSSSSKEEEDTTLALVLVEAAAPSKRDRQPSDYQSPKKLKVLLPELFTQAGSAEAPTKKLKMPEFSSKFNARSLGLIEAPGSILIPKSEVVGTAETKKKRGRPLGAKNKNPPKQKKVADAQEACLAFLTKPPSPSVKGKEKI
ncbi:hypothetical protein ABKV19_008575 [Rosa sericea]